MNLVIYVSWYFCNAGSTRVLLSSSFVEDALSETCKNNIFIRIGWYCCVTPRTRVPSTILPFTCANISHLDCKYRLTWREFEIIRSDGPRLAGDAIPESYPAKLVYWQYVNSLPSRRRRRHFVLHRVYVNELSEIGTMTCRHPSSCGQNLPQSCRRLARNLLVRRQLSRHGYQNLLLSRLFYLWRRVCGTNRVHCKVKDGECCLEFDKDSCGDRVLQAFMEIVNSHWDKIWLILSLYYWKTLICFLSIKFCYICVHVVAFWR